MYGGEEEQEPVDGDAVEGRDEEEEDEDDGKNFGFWVKLDILKCFELFVFAGSGFWTSRWGGDRVHIFSLLLFLLYELNFLVLIVKLIFGVLWVSFWFIFQYGMFIYEFILVSAEEGQDEYEKDGFIVDDVEEEEEEEEEEERADSDEERQKKKKKRKKK